MHQRPSMKETVDKVKGLRKMVLVANIKYGNCGGSIVLMIEYCVKNRNDNVHKMDRGGALYINSIEGI